MKSVVPTVLRTPAISSRPNDTGFAAMLVTATCDRPVTCTSGRLTSVAGGGFSGAVKFTKSDADTWPSQASISAGVTASCTVGDAPAPNPHRTDVSRAVADAQPDRSAL